MIVNSDVQVIGSAGYVLVKYRLSTVFAVYHNFELNNNKDMYIAL